MAPSVCHQGLQAFLAASDTPSDMDDASSFTSGMMTPTTTLPLAPVFEKPEFNKTVVLFHNVYPNGSIVHVDLYTYVRVENLFDKKGDIRYGWLENHAGPRLVNTMHWFDTPAAHNVMTIRAAENVLVALHELYDAITPSSPSPRINFFVTDYSNLLGELPDEYKIPGAAIVAGPVKN
ncbi:hypothetical protein BDZ85DRAFT_257078 [Elsinoe ampelina]|uniref:Uncharacterized protein n=1 Tax=Elsinoe ampelina TaxID=302913 RepID=A0A6A6GMM6_9PEZI|nr:hypothetical protein BDZ85DRAFT_257078 [Elsinoe ampelina]